MLLNMLGGKFRKSASIVMMNSNFVSRICYRETVEVLSKVEKISGILFNKHQEIIHSLDRNISHIKHLPASVKSDVNNINKNSPSFSKPRLDFSYGSNLFNSNVHLLSVNHLSSISASNNYCTQTSRRKVKKIKESLNPLDEQDQLSDRIRSSSSIEEVTNLFPSPKHTLSNIYQIVKNEKGSSGVLLCVPTFRSVKQKWTCTYELKWPQEKSISYTDSSKKQASTKCAWMVLQYLLDNKYIDKKGTPKLYDKEDIKALVKENIPVLNLNHNHMDQLEQITNLYKHQILPIIENCKDASKSENLFESQYERQRKAYEPVFLGYNKYICREDPYLPISDYKEEIIQKIKQNRVVIVKGETGCGKSTRLPQYILEGWAREAEDTGNPCNIIVTEPRRIAAISLADRVASERSEKVGKVVGYRVRFKSEFQNHTGRIMYCTNGVLLQYFKSDPNLSNYTHIVIDEAHERDINTDLLLNMLRDVLDENPALKVIVMSATINTELFQNYFKDSSLIHIPGFTYPVESHFLDTLELNLEKTKKMCKESEPTVIHEDVVKVLMHLHNEKPEGAVLCFLPGWEDIKKIRELIPNRQDLMVLCLHSRLQDSEQWRIFNKAPPGVRKIILATNIAETSVTIDDICYVVDTGIHKETRYDIDKGSACIDNHWISKSNVEQRKGRAGRVQAGECFHLYPQSKLKTLPQFPLPEILRVSLTKIVLDSKAIKSDKKALDFFNNLPSPPDEDTVKQAVDELMDLELFDANENLTPLGHVLHNFQLEPKLAKALINSVIFKCVSPVVDIITLFSAGTEMFTSGLERKSDIRDLKAVYSQSSDHVSLMKIFEIWNRFMEDGNQRKAENFVRDLGLVPSKMHFLKALKEIHYNYICDGLKRNVLPISDDFSDEDEMVKAVLMSSIGTFLTHKNWDIVKGRVKKSNVFLTRMNQKATVTPDSVNFKRIPRNSQFLLYINETRSNVRRITLIRETTLIPAVMVLLFSNKELKMQDIDPKQFSTNLNSDDQVKIELGDSKISFVLDREQALKILECRLALSACYDHYIFQLTEGGEQDRELDGLWNNLLEILSEFLSDFKNK
ncbi:ATP-dependent RNA helicase DHX30-like [Coccinella septempunctata]|uniref:ATP-dependent RNA helicase DHX30-like n=1 Tax=Coccinella septempunctata TaxID=41139 RepID=UPI001D0940E0|nr:ATP-dependent RNA helicase DHX30-like [Coccinella septempunctata]XP_044745922.1 ATP-dependent RNA helicase DHX30-like [Coccinella septempunctata]